MFADGELRNAGDRMSTAFIESLMTSKGRRGGMKDVFQGIGQDIGRDLANEAGKGLTDFVMDQGKELAKYIKLGGKDAAGAIAGAAATLYGLSAIFGMQGKKKQTGGILGGILGGVV